MVISGIKNFTDYQYTGTQSVYHRENIQINGVSSDEDTEKLKLNEDLSSARDKSASDSRKYTAFDYALEFDSKAVYPMKGKDSDISLLDRTPDASDEKVDQLMEQYRLFDGDRKTLSLGASRPTQNFETV